MAGFSECSPKAARPVSITYRHSGASPASIVPESRPAAFGRQSCRSGSAHFRTNEVPGIWATPENHVPGLRTLRRDHRVRAEADGRLVGRCSRICRQARAGGMQGAAERRDGDPRHPGIKPRRYSAGCGRDIQVAFSGASGRW